MEEELKIRLARLEEKFSGMETKFTQMDKKQDKIYDAIENLKTSLQHSLNKSIIIESKVKEHDERLSDLEPKINNLSSKVAGISSIIGILIFALSKLLFG